MDVLAAASDDGMPDPFGYFGIARVKFGGQEVVITRTGYTNELGWEFYTEPHHDADELWAHLAAAGAPFGMEIFGLDAMIGRARVLRSEAVVVPSAFLAVGMGSERLARRCVCATSTTTCGGSSASSPSTSRTR